MTDDRLAAEALHLAQGLLRCRSVTPADDGALAFCAAYLAEAGFTVERPVFEEPGSPAIENLYARAGGAGPCLVFAGHTDVVPPGDPATWRHDPFAGTVEDGWLHGRGAVDMKGGVAASLAAAAAVMRDRAAGDGAVAILLTGDEEGPAVNGTVKLLRWVRDRGDRLDHCVLGEPTNPEALGDMIKIGRRGSLTGRIVVEGRQGHVAYPHLAANPIPVLARLVTALAEPPLDAGTAHFDPSSLQFTTVDVGNPATNVVPAAASAVFNIRFNDLWDPDGLAAEIAARLDRAAAGGRYRLSFDPTNSLAFLTKLGPFVDLVADAVQRETGRRPALSTTGGTSDARFIKDVCPVVEFGLVGQTMHAVDERVPVADLGALARIYRAIAASYFGASGAGLHT
jgi:succinyl-diaminopimelate desuccinylase